MSTRTRSPSTITVQLPNEAHPKIISSQEFTSALGRPSARVLFIVLAIIIIGIIHGVFSGFDFHAAILLGGSVASFAGTFFLSRALATHADSGRTSSLSLAGLIPYAFGCYLVFYRGLWSVRSLFGDFSFGSAIFSLAFIYFGYRLVYWTWQLTELGEALRTKRLVVTR